MSVAAVEPKHRSQEKRNFFTKLETDSAPQSQTMQRLANKSLDMVKIQRQKVNILSAQIKRNNVNDIIHNERAINLTLQNSEQVLNKKAHSYLTVQRKKYDEVKKIQKLKEDEIVRMKNELDSLRSQHAILEGQKDDTADQVAQLQHKCETQRKHIEDFTFEKSIMQHIMQRSKWDLVQYEKRSQRLQAEQKCARNTLEQTVKQSKEHLQQYQLGQNVLNQIVVQVQENLEQRDQQLSQLGGEVELIKAVEKRQRDNTAHHHEVAEQAAWEIQFANIKKWRQLLMVQKCMESMLKFKQKKLIDFYQPYDACYQRIKTESGVADSKEIISKFQSKEKDYDTLTRQILTYEDKVQALLSERQRLTQQLTMLQNEHQGGKDLEPLQKKTAMKAFKDENYTMQKMLGFFSEKERSLNVIQQQIALFNHRCLKKIVKVGGQATVIESENSTVEQFTSNLKEVKAFLQNYKDNDFENDKSRLMDLDQNELLDLLRAEKGEPKKKYTRLEEDSPQVNTQNLEGLRTQSDMELSKHEAQLEKEREELDYFNQIRSLTKKQVQAQIQQHRKQQKDQEAVQ